MYLFIKRFFDLLVAIIALLLLLPLFIPIVIALKLTAEREVFYFQERIGLNRKRFKIWKFATMLKNSPNIGTGMITLRNDSRVTTIGRFLRITKLNELPQIFNILIGDMSVVGPRPLVDKTFNAYSDEVQNKIYICKPGITGIGSVIFRDEEKMLSDTNMPPAEFYDNVIAPYKGALELWYLKNISFYTDFMLIFLTAWVIFFPKSNLPHRVFPDLPAAPKAIGKSEQNAVSSKEI